ncbi:MAG: HAD family hydrolase [Bryobacterales bacterium]
MLPELLRIHRSHEPTLALAPDVRATLRRLRMRFRLGLVSDGRLEQQRAKAEALGLAALLDALVFSDELGREHWKPDPAPYWKALERLGVSPTEAVYVGDNPAKDFLGARRAGMRSVRLRRPDGLHAAAEPQSAEAAPDAEVATFSELEALIGSPQGSGFATL